MASDSDKISDITKNGNSLKDTEKGIGSDPLKQNSDLMGQEKAKPAKSPDTGNKGYYSNPNDKDGVGKKGEQSTQATAREATRAGKDVAEGNLLGAAEVIGKNWKAFLKLSVKSNVALAVGSLVAIMLGLGLTIFMLSATSGLIGGVVNAANKMSGAYYAEKAYNGISRAASWANPFSYNPDINNSKLGRKLASLNMSDSMQQLAILGNRQEGDQSNGSTFASTSFLSQLAGFADLSNSKKDLDPSKAAGNLNSVVSYKGNKIIINGESIDLPSSNATPAQLKSYYSKIGAALKTTDPFKVESAAPQLDSFNKEVRQQYKLPQESWANKGEGYTDLSQKDAFKKIQQDTNKTTMGSISPIPSSLPFVQNLQDEIKTKLTKSVGDGDNKPEDIAQADLNKFLIDNVLNGKNDDLDPSTLAGYSICLVNDINLNARQSTQDMTSSSMRQAAAMASAGSQATSGDLHGNELGGNLNLYGDMYSQGNYQRAIYNKNWSDPNAFKQLSQASYQQLEFAKSKIVVTKIDDKEVELVLNQAPPDGFIGKLQEIVNYGMTSPSATYDVGIYNHKPLEWSFVNHNNKCGSTDDIHTSVSTDRNTNFIMKQVLSLIPGGGPENAVKKYIAQVEQVMTTYMTQSDGLGLNALSLIPGSVFSSSVKLGFSYLLKASIMNNLGLNYAGLSNNNYTNQAVSGFSLMGGEESRKMTYGRPLTLGEVNAFRGKQLADHKVEMDNMPIFAKLADVSSPYSLASQLAVASTGWRNDALGKTVSSIGSSLALVSQPSKILASAGQMVFNNSGVTQDNIAYAADNPSDFVGAQYPDPNGGNLQWGWSQAEMDKIQSDSSYSLLKNADLVEGWEDKADSEQAKYIETIKPCFRDDVSGVITDIKLKGVCEGMKDNDTALRYRLYKSDETTISDLKDLQTITQDASGSSSTSSTAGATIDMDHVYDDSSSVACAPSTQDVGTQDGYRSGNLVKIKLCAIPGLTSGGEESKSITGAGGNAVVNSRASGAVYAMTQAAKADGISLVATSSFRSMSHQQELWDANPNPNDVAQPGTSNHQMGLAIDFDVGGKCPAKIGGQCSSPGNPIWDWLSKNASKFGYKSSVKSEAWHWSPAGN